MQKNDLRVFPRPNGRWAMQRDGASRVISTYDTKRAALDAGQRKATQDGVDLTIQNRCGWVTQSGTHLLEELAGRERAGDLLTRQRTSPA